MTLVDAKHIEIHLDEEKPEGVENEALEQIAFADRIVINKTDLVSDVDLERIETRIRSINAMAKMSRSAFGEIDLDQILDVGAFDLGRVLEMDPRFLTESEHQHDQSVTSVGIEVQGSVEGKKLNDWLGERLLQGK